MSINLELPKLTELKPRIVVVGVGGAGGNAINNMIASGLTGVEYIAANTDAQALSTSSAERRIQLGANLTEGLGAGSKPEIGEAAAEEAIEEIKGQVAGAHMVFIAAGMGGGTGTGAAAVIARAAREMGVLTVGIVTKPFLFEGTRRLRMADAGIVELRKYVDTLIVIPNQNLFRIATEKTTFAEAFVLADQVLYSGVACIVDLIVKDGLINLDFADVRTVMTGMGTAMMGTGEASGERRALRAAEEAISNPLLDEVTLKGAKGLLLSIIGGRDMTLYEVDEAASRVRQEVDPEANIIVGATFDDSLGDHIRVAIVASGLNSPAQAQPQVQSFAQAQPYPQAEQHAQAGSSSGEPAGARSEPQPMRPFNQPQPAAPHAHPETPAVSTATPPLPPHATPFGATQAPGAATPPLPIQSPFALDGRPGAAQSPRQPEPPQSRVEPTGVREPFGAKAVEEPRELWRGPGNVVIEETRPSRQQPQAGRTPAPAPAAGKGYAGPNDPFRPSPPEDLRPPAPRRVPDLEEFPTVGQRDYRAKAGQYDAPHGQPEPRHRDGAATAESAQRGGLLQRMMGGGRRNESSEDDDASQRRGDGTARPSGFFNRNKG